MPFFSRIHCHFCGTRSAYNKSSGVSEFQCSSCEAVNFLDSQGNIVDTPAAAIAQSQRIRASSPPLQIFTQQLPDSLRHQENQSFCTTCQHNQRIVMEALSNYLPDDDDPEYQKYEDALPQYREQLEQRYPQICRKCAPKAQSQIHRADYYAGTHNINRLSRDTARGARLRRQRDDWWKWCMRRVMSIIGLAVYVSLLLQVVWHAYGICMTFSKDINESGDRDQEIGLVFQPSTQDCIRDAARLRFDRSCYDFLASYMPRALLASACLVWYNPRLPDWFHHTHRIEAITGQTEYLRLQLLGLAVRVTAWYNLSNTAFITACTAQQLIAAHVFVILAITVVAWISCRTVKSVRFKLKQKMMPKPEQRDVLGAFAGPDFAGTSDEAYARQPSSIPPSQLFARDHLTPFPIANLAPKQPTRNRATVMPSPPPSDETDEEGDPMQLDQPQSASSQLPGAPVDRTYRGVMPQKLSTSNSRSIYNHGSSHSLGWSGMRESIFGIQDDLQAESERKRQEAEQKAKLRYEPPVEQSPFRGRLPQAPMSMERRLRNPVTQVSFRKTPVSKQQDFLQQMRNGIEQGKSFARQQQQQAEQRRPDAFGLSLDDSDEDRSPEKRRPASRGMELKPSTWYLPADLKQAQTGLEDMFGGNSFRIADEPAIDLPASQRTSKVGLVGVSVLVAVVGVVAAFVGNVGGCRTAVCLWLYHRLDAMGV